MIELLYASGLRISELANARLENFNFEERVIRVTGKETRRGLWPVAARHAKHWQRYLSTERPKLVKSAAAAKFFFPSAEPKLTTARIWQIVNNMRGAPDSNSAFTLTFCDTARNASAAHADLRIIQEMLVTPTFRRRKLYTVDHSD